MRSQNCEKRAFNFVMSVCPSVLIEQLGSHWTDFYEMRCLRIFRNSIEKIQVLLKSDKTNGYFIHEDLCTFIFISCSLLLRRRNLSDKGYRENQNTILCSIIFFFFENRAVFEMRWKNNVQPGRPHPTIQYGTCALHAG